jgi:cytochrome c peroxidase
MAGQYNENDISRAVRQGRISGEGGAWDLIGARVAAIPAYAQDFARVYPHIGAGDPIGFTDISNAIAAFIELEWRADDSAFDRHLRAEAALTGAAAEGMALFYGEAGCAACHSGALQTDHDFHAMGQPQLGPGKAARFEGNHRDMGRYRVTGHEADRYAFRTPSLRNVTLTGPWGHAGAFDDLGAFLRNHLDPVTGLDAYTPQAVLPGLKGAADWEVMANVDERADIARAVMFAPVPLSEAEIAALLAFLGALEDRDAVAGVFGVPEAVPSGLVVER